MNNVWLAVAYYRRNPAGSNKMKRDVNSIRSSVHYSYKNSVHVIHDTIVEGPVAQWIRHRPTEPGIAGSSPAGVILAAG